MSDQSREFVATIRRLCGPLEPIPTETPPRLRKFDGIRAVLFDVYGTLVISGSGDVGTSADGRGDAFLAALEQVGAQLSSSSNGDEGVETLTQVIQDEHQRLNESGIEDPEVDIVQVWNRTLGLLAESGRLLSDPVSVDVEHLAVEYECRANPVWPMPGSRDCLAWLRSRGFELGIVSNAQFFTPFLFPALFDETLANLGFQEKIQFFSYRFGRAKPGTYLYKLAATALKERGIAPQQTLYIGNDMLNDVTPAAETGFRTALFAGDRRSLRLRPGEPRLEGIQPDLVVSHLSQLTDFVNR